MGGFKLSSDLAAQRAGRALKPNALTNAYSEVVDVGLLSVNGDGTLIEYNREFAHLCALPQRPRAVATVGEIVEWLLQQRDERALVISKLLSGVTASNGEVVLSDGRALEWRRAAIAGAGGHVWAFADVSEARQRSAALLDAANWLRMLEAHTEGVLLELDASARIVGLWGPSGSFFDERDPQLQGKTLSETIPGPEGMALDARVRLLLSSGIRQDYDCCVEVGGAPRVLSTSAVLMPRSEGMPASVTLMIRDVTERAHLHAKLLEAERLASVGLLAAGVAHEVNNPLAYVLLNLERVRSGLERLRAEPSGASGAAPAVDVLAELRAAIDMSIEGAAKVRGIVQDLKRFSHPEQDRSLPVDIHRSLDFAIAMAEPELQGRARLTRSYGTLPVVQASEARLSQVFLNLLVNAAHSLPGATSERGEIRVVTRTAAGGEAVVEVHDTGHGISSAAQRRIFEPFYTTKPPGVGMGLGLTICHDVVSTLGGWIEVESSEGRGSVFRIVLPPAGLSG